MILTPEDRSRRRDAKLFNERLKLIAGVLNASCIAVIGAAIIIPGITTQTLRSTGLLWLFAAAVLHLVAQAILTFYRSED